MARELLSSALDRRVSFGHQAARPRGLAHLHRRRGARPAAPHDRPGTRGVVGQPVRPDSPPAPDSPCDLDLVRKPEPRSRPAWTRNIPARCQLRNDWALLWPDAPQPAELPGCG